MLEMWAALVMIGGAGGMVVAMTAKAVGFKESATWFSSGLVMITIGDWVSVQSDLLHDLRMDIRNNSK